MQSFETIKSLGICKDEAEIVDEFATASLSAKLAKSNIFMIIEIVFSII